MTSKPQGMRRTAERGEGIGNTGVARRDDGGE
jgi:hypothetical protein